MPVELQLSFVSFCVQLCTRGSADKKVFKESLAVGVLQGRDLALYRLCFVCREDTSSEVAADVQGICYP